MDSLKAILIMIGVAIPSFLLTLFVVGSISNGIFKVTFAYVAGLVTLGLVQRLLQFIGPQAGGGE